MREPSEPLAFMTPAQQADYCRWLMKLAGCFPRQPGPVSLFLKRAVTELSGRYM